MKLTIIKSGSIYQAIDSTGKVYFSSMTRANVKDFLSNAWQQKEGV
jgi:hypothetical protein